MIFFKAKYFLKSIGSRLTPIDTATLFAPSLVESEPNMLWYWLYIYFLDIFYLLDFWNSNFLGRTIFTNHMSDPPWRYISGLQNPVSAAPSYWTMIASPCDRTWEDVRSLLTYIPRDGHPYNVVDLWFALEALIPFLFEKVNLPDSFSLIWPVSCPHLLEKVTQVLCYRQSISLILLTL